MSDDKVLMYISDDSKNEPYLEVEENPSPRRSYSQQLSLQSRNQDSFNERFQRLLETQISTEEERNRNLEQITDLFDQFKKKATQEGRKIIEMTELQRRECSLAQGIAGGQKFCFSDIFYKFARDDRSIYGGDQYAQKAAGHELRSMTELVNLRIPQLHLPLACIIDHLGHRLLAMSKLPIGKDTLIHGSDDGGRTFRPAKHPEVEKLVQQVSLALNLHPHMFHQHRVYLCVDLELHLGYDGRIYIIDAARLWPPTYDINSHQKGRIFYNLFRPEFVKNNTNCQLNADALSSFGRFDPDSHIHNRNISDASNRLKTEQVRECAKVLIENFKTIAATPGALCRFIHKTGVNLRYLKLIVQQLDTSEEGRALKVLISIEMVARSFKSFIQENLRIQTDEFSPHYAEEFESECHIYTEQPAPIFVESITPPAENIFFQNRLEAIKGDDDDEPLPEIGDDPDVYYRINPAIHPNLLSKKNTESSLQNPPTNTKQTVIDYYTPQSKQKANENYSFSANNDPQELPVLNEDEPDWSFLEDSALHNFIPALGDSDNEVHLSLSAPIHNNNNKNSEPQEKGIFDMSAASDPRLYESPKVVARRPVLRTLDTSVGQKSGSTVKTGSSSDHYQTGKGIPQKYSNSYTTCENDEVVPESPVGLLFNQISRASTADVVLKCQQIVSLGLKYLFDTDNRSQPATEFRDALTELLAQKYQTRIPSELIVELVENPKNKTFLFSRVASLLLFRINPPLSVRGVRGVDLILSPDFEGSWIVLEPKIKAFPFQPRLDLFDVYKTQGFDGLLSVESKLSKQLSYKLVDHDIGKEDPQVYLLYEQLATCCTLLITHSDLTIETRYFSMYKYLCSATNYLIGCFNISKRIEHFPQAIEKIAEIIALYSQAFQKTDRVPYLQFPRYEKDKTPVAKTSFNQDQRGLLSLSIYFFEQMVQFMKEKELNQEIFWVASSLLSISQSLISRKEKAFSVRILHRALTIFQKTNSLTQVATCYNILMELAEHEDKEFYEEKKRETEELTPQAIHPILKALKLQKKLHPHNKLNPDLGRAYLDTARYFLRQNKFSRSKRKLEKAQNIFSKLYGNEDVIEFALILLCQGQSDFKKGCFTEAKESILQALNIFEKREKEDSESSSLSRNQIEYAECILVLCQIYIRDEDKEKAENMLQRLGEVLSSMNESNSDLFILSLQDRFNLFQTHRQTLVTGVFPKVTTFKEGFYKGCLYLRQGTSTDINKGEKKKGNNTQKVILKKMQIFTYVKREQSPPLTLQKKANDNLNESISQKTKYHQIFLNQLKAFHNLIHPNIVSIFGWTPGEIDIRDPHSGCSAYLVFQNFFTSTLSSALRTGLSAQAKCQIANQVCGVLKFLQNQGYILFNLSSENFSYCPTDMRLKLVDMTYLSEKYLVQQKDQPLVFCPLLRTVEDVWLSPEFFVPEFAYFAKEIEFEKAAKHDIFTLGLMFWELIEDTPVTLIKAHYNDTLRAQKRLPFKDLDRIHPDFLKLILETWEDDPKHRPELSSICDEIRSNAEGFFQFTPQKLDESMSFGLPIEIRTLVTKLRNPNTTLPVSTKSHLLSSYSKVFEGKQLVDWILKHSPKKPDSRQAAVSVGANLLNHGVFFSALGEKKFKDDTTYYRFRWDMDPISLRKRRYSTNQPVFNPDVSLSHEILIRHSAQFEVLGSSNSTFNSIGRSGNHFLKDSLSFLAPKLQSPFTRTAQFGTHRTTKLTDFSFEQTLRESPSVSEILTRLRVDYPLELTNITGKAGTLVIEEVLNQRPELIDQTDSDQRTPIFLASQYGQSEMTHLLLTYKPNLQIRNSAGESPLSIACQYGYVDIVKVLLAAGAPKDLRNNEHQTPFMVACKYGHEDIIHLFLPDVQINLRDSNGDTSLLIAWKNGHSKLGQVLIKNGADVNISNSQELTPFHIAVEKGDLESVQLLVESGAIWKEDKTSRLPIHIACQQGNAEIVGALVRSQPDSVHKQTPRVAPPLVSAAKNGSLETVKVLVENGADVSSVGKHGVETFCFEILITPLVSAAANGHIQVVKYLLEKKADFSKKTEQGFSPLMVATQKGNYELVELLLKHKAPVDERTKAGETPLFLACKEGHDSIAALLIQYNADVNAQRTDDQWSPLYVASRNGHFPLVKLLIQQKRIDLNLTTVDDRTPLYAACLEGHDVIAEALIKKGFSIEKEDSLTGKTPLVLAIEKRKMAIIQALLSSGANITKKNKNLKNLSPYDYAKTLGPNDEICKVFRQEKKSRKKEGGKLFKF